MFTAVKRLAQAAIRSRVRRERTGSFLARVRDKDLALLKDLAEAGRLTAVIDRRYPLTGVPDAIRYLGARAVRGKIVINVR